MHQLALFILSMALFSTGTLAHDAPTPTFDRISFTENASTEVDNDLLVAVLFVQREGKRADHLAEEVNELVNRAVDKAKSSKGIKVQTLSYRTNAVYRKSNISGWRVHQSIRLESRNSQLLGTLIAELQKNLSVKSIGYQVSEEKRREHTDRLITRALENFRKRAQAITAAMGKKGYKVVNLSINSNGHNPAPVARSMMMDAASIKLAPARIEAGTQRLQVTVNGQIELTGR